ncbi:MAG: hypothetical protein AAF429_11240 [Pseudomonadota bacterium]
MEPRIPFDRWLGLFFCLFAIIAIFIWIPMDTGSGIVEKVRRKFVIGDALGPTVAAMVILLGGLITAWRPIKDASKLSLANWIWVGKLFLLFLISLSIMRYLGPLLLAGTESGYRPLRGTIPWKYLGFLAGGMALIGGLGMFVRGRLLWRDMVIGFAAALIIALAYDLPFDDLLLPPNGDV